jgi:hypothetical protein
MSAWSRIAELDPAYRRYREQVKATGPTCTICGHPGARSVDHWRSPARYPTIAVQLALDPANWRPSHGIEGCYLCPPNNSRDRRRRGQPRRCNQEKGARDTPYQTVRRW